MLAIVVVDLLPRMLLMCTGAEGSLVKKERYKGYEAFIKCIMYFMTKLIWINEMTTNCWTLWECGPHDHMLKG